MKRANLLTILSIVVALVPPAYLALIWNSVPQTVPIHFDESLNPDRYGSRNELWYIALIIAAVSILLFILLKNIHRIDPKRKNQPSSRFTQLAIGLVIFMSALSLLIIFSAAHNTRLMENLLFPFMGLLFAFLGNYMVNIKPNYFAGFRLPWTLNNNENWRRTHQLGGKLWFWGGLALAMICLIIPVKFAAPLFIIVMVILTAIPAIYSYRIFKGKVKE
ncbi:MAG: SdpI family protein [Flavisolibacter sp.]|jgi:uncharacterized membrane protein|nr:SdpI family protein [Flavisolibacter sp.]